MHGKTSSSSKFWKICYNSANFQSLLVTAQVAHCLISLEFLMIFLTYKCRRIFSRNCVDFQWIFEENFLQILKKMQKCWKTSWCLFYKKIWTISIENSSEYFTMFSISRVFFIYRKFVFERLLKFLPEIMKKSF